VDSFRSEEIIMRMMHRLSNLELTELGLTTMGARMRFREAVESWVARDDPGEASAEAAGHVVPEVCQDAAAEVLKMLCPVCLNIFTSYIDRHLRHMHRQ
jgi:hypothetical protein